jgi:hypothetical protein
MNAPAHEIQEIDESVFALPGFDARVWVWDTPEYRRCFSSFSEFHLSQEHPPVRSASKYRP